MKEQEFTDFYETVTITTDKNLYKINIENLPPAVVNYLKKFYEVGWTPDNEAEWQIAFALLENMYPNETIKKIAGKSFFTDIIYCEGD